ncbi:MAG TPA: hypothetical protein DDW24_06270 [Blastocatellia bacterium]|nr:hypothetical protein [Blastocatellia bacterium]
MKLQRIKIEIFNRKHKMRKFVTVGKFGVAAAIALLLSIPSFAQLSLRKAIDTDNDGKADFSVFRPTNNTWYTFKSAGGVSIQTFGLANEDFMTPGDFDGDGKGDVAVWRDTTGAWYWLNSSDSTFNGILFGLTGDEPVARDYDGDGKTDPAVARRSNGAMIWYVLRSSDGGFVAQQFGLSTDFTAPGDYDGDNKFDFAIQRPGATSTSQATFYVQRSTGGFDIIPWGWGNDLVVPGDYDGDGKTDIAVVREGSTPSSNLAWFIRRSTDGGLIALTFGITSSDLNVQNDYDGDGKTDVAIWRNTDGQFYVLRSLDGVLAVVQWGLPNDFPVAAYDSH